MTETNTSNDDTTQEQKDGTSHRGFSQKVRGILLESQSTTSDKLPNMPNKSLKKNVQTTTAPHRGFNEKAREMLLDRKNPVVTVIAITITITATTTITTTTITSATINAVARTILTALTLLSQQLLLNIAH
ncbi:unnamed protein product [Wuchereria bancrofti]|uniref:Uncharacterized protein n=1 Tax=Wuchereria bancrofti TaxID=6293 RepID=A0A3P7FVU9_WUCBA|nr:unnamed protein product [Wuchereria bancrofti]